MATSDLSSEIFKDFEYSVLPHTHFRLLRIINVDAPLRCEIQDFARDEAPEYCALSYAWGTGEKKEIIVCSERTIHISTNLFLALYEIGTREELDNAWVWIDAICINQENTAEKNIQVKNMGSIFSSTSKVVVWLGPAEDDNDLAMDNIDGLGSILAPAASHDLQTQEALLSSLPPPSDPV
jgi:hypothetical protein